MPTYGQVDPESLAKAQQAALDARARAQNGRRLAQALHGSRIAREALGVRMAAVTRHNEAGDRKNG